MIEVNLLPEDRRPVERTPLPRFLTILAGVVGVCIEGLLLVWILVDHPRQQDQLKGLHNDIRSKQKEIKKKKDLERRIDAFRARSNDVEDLEEDRREWAPLLHRLSAPEVLPSNIWYSELKLKHTDAGRKKAAVDELYLFGYSRASSDSANVNTMFKAITKFCDNLKVPHKGFSEQFKGVPQPSGYELVDLPVAKDSPPAAPKQAVKFTVKLDLVPKPDKKQKQKQAQKTGAGGKVEK